MYHLIEGRLDNEVNESDLTLSNVSRLSIEELADFETVHLFKVSLCEELYKEQVTPEPAELPRLGRIRNVCQVEHELDEELFVLGLLWVELLIHDSTAQVAQLYEVLRHVRSEDRLDYYVPYSFEAFSVHVDCPVVLFFAAFD